MTAGRLYGDRRLRKTIQTVEIQVRSYESDHHTVVGAFDTWKQATGRPRSEALFLKWQAVRDRAAWDVYRFSPAGMRNDGAL